MKPADIAKLAFGVVLLGTAAVLAYNVLWRPSPASKVVIEMLCRNPACNAEFEMERGEMERMAKAREALKCPKCGSLETEQAHRCGSCLKLNPPFGHGGAPPKCEFCKKPWTYAKKPK